MCLPVPILTVASFRGALAGTLPSHIQIIDSVGSLHQQSWPVMSWTNRDFLTKMFKITWLNIASCRRGDLELFPTSSRMSWTPSPFKLLNGNPFEYSDHTIPSISGTEAFETGIKTRDAEKCVVCGLQGQRVLKFCHIIPKEEYDTVRYALLFFTVSEIGHGTVEDNEATWFCA